MDGDQAGIRASAWADEILAERGYRARRRRMAACAEPALGAVAEALTRRARSRMHADPRDALQCGLLAARAARSRRLPDGQIEALHAAGEAACALGRFGAALRLVDAAVHLASSRGDTERVAALSLLKLDPLIHLGRYREARSVGQLLLHAMATAGDAHGLLRTRMALAERHLMLDEPREALREYRCVDALLTDEVDVRFRARLATRRAQALVEAHRFRAAARHFALADSLLADGNREAARARIAFDCAAAESRSGHHVAALRGLAAAAEIFGRERDERGLAAVDFERAAIHLLLDLPTEAAHLALQAEERYAELGMGRERAQAALRAGQALLLARRYEKARAALVRAEALFDALQLPLRRAACRLQRVRLALELEQDDEARADLAWAEAVGRRFASPTLPAAIELLDARLRLAARTPEAATDALERIEAAWNRSRAPWVRVEALQLRAHALATLGEVDAAADAYRHAIEEMDSYRGGMPPDEYVTSFLTARTTLYDGIVDLFVRAGDEPAAFEFAERAKSRALAGPPGGHGGEERRTRAQVVAGRRTALLRRRLGAVYRRMFGSDGGDPRRRDRARLEVDRIEQRLERRPRAATGAIDFRALQACLAPDTTLIEYWGTDRALFTFVVTPDEIHAVRQAIPATELRRHAERFGFHIARFHCGDPERDEFQLHAARVNLDALTDILLEPIRERLRTRRLLVVPHGDLHAVPFHALTWNDGWVADHFEVVQAPSASVHLRGGRAPRVADGPAFVFGVADDAAREADFDVCDAAAGLGDARCWRGAEATYERLREAARSASVLHIASRGVYRPGHPMRSAIRLADRWVDLDDIDRLRIEADLVVLSASESGATRASTGGEVLGLMRGFLVHGPRALLASQWRVPDPVAADLLRTFYEALAAGGDPVQAHRAAMAATREKHPHPYFWAPFVLSGHPLPLGRDAATARDGASDAMALEGNP